MRTDLLFIMEPTHSWLKAKPVGERRRAAAKGYCSIVVSIPPMILLAANLTEKILYCILLIIMYIQLIDSAYNIRLLGKRLISLHRGKI